MTPMDISIRTVSSHCGISETEFQPGDRVWSILYRDESGVIERLDILSDELDRVELSGGILCRWSQGIKEPEVSEAEERRAALRSTEEVFLNLYEEDNEADPEEAVKEARDRLKFFLAIQLERKRILKPLRANVYRHLATKREYTVPALELTRELAVQFQQEMASMGTGL